GRSCDATARVRPARVAANGAVWRGHDYRLGCASHRHSALGHEYRAYGADRSLGISRVSDAWVVGCSWAVQDIWAVCEWRRDDGFRRVSERNQVVRDEGMDLCTARRDELADGKARRSGAEG